MDHTLYNALIDLAKNDKIAAYSEIAPLLELDMSNDEDREDIAIRLCEIAKFEHSNGRPMLTALVVHKGNDNNPGEGFFAIAKDLGLYEGSRNPIKRLTFWTNQVTQVHNLW